MYKKNEGDSETELESIRSNYKFTEKLGHNGQTRTYSLSNSQCLKIKVENTHNTFVNTLQTVCKQIFLPVGYPDSVSKDYTKYQIWDTVQAFCSTIMGTFTTRSVLQSVGVGDNTATPLAAAITWILKDGSGMIGRILFAWMQGEYLDSDCKPWRLFADILNDMAMSIEFMLPYLNFGSMYVLCITSTMKSIVGVAGGATRAAITQHQAIKGNMGDVSAKDGSQETCVNLLASILGIFLLTYLENHNFFLGIGFVLLIGGHIYSNYRAVKSLVFKHLNLQRLLIVLRSYMQHDAVSNPVVVNKLEPLVLIGFKSSPANLCGFNIKIGHSVKKAIRDMDPRDLRVLSEAFKGNDYLVIPHFRSSTLFVALSRQFDARTVFRAYFHATVFGMVLCQYNNVNLTIKAKRQLHHVTPIQRLGNLMKRFPRNQETELGLPPLDKLLLFNEFVASESTSFFTALNVNDWDLSRHSLNIGEWRCELDSNMHDDTLKKLN